MWFLVLLTFVNALADNDLVLRYRFTVGGFPVNVFDVLILVIGPIAVALTRRNAVPTGRYHPMLPWIFVLFIAAALGGLLGSVMSSIPLRATITTLRNLISLPICIWLGYCLMLRPRSAERVCYAHVIVGIATAFFVLFSFGRKAAVMNPGGGLETLRAVKYVAVYAGIAAVLVLYASVSGVRMFRLAIAILVCSFCFLGQLATLSRGDWLALFTAVSVVYFLLPAARRGGKVAAALVGLPVAVGCVWIGLFAASVATGTDFNKKMTDRLMSMLPGEQPGVKKKAWDTRLASTFVELKWWSESPLVGRGFGIHEAKFRSLSQDQAMGLRHNTWSSTLAETGIIGFSAMALVVVGTFVVSRRMVRDWTDRGTVLVGALGVVTASIFGVLGVTTMAFNQMRGAIPLGIVCGIILRCRAMQQAALAQAMAQQQQQAYGYGDEYYEGVDPYDAGHAPYPSPGPAY
jgi:hypothetical protein